MLFMNNNFLFRHKFMLELECLAVTGPTGTLMSGSGIRGAGNGLGNFARFFLGGLQPTLLEVDAVERWGEVINTIDVGIGGSVVLRPFSGGLCAGNTNGKVSFSSLYIYLRLIHFLISVPIVS